MPTNIFSSKIHFVAGKGGVGKTLISQALATYFAEKNSTLLVELSEEEAKEDHKFSTIKEVSKNLSHVKIFPDQALYEYLSLKIPEKLVDSMLSKSLFRALGSAMPGLSDLTRLGKIWYHTKDFEKIVVDMPSSGFVSRFLSIASIVEKAVKIGPLAKEAKLIDDYLKDPAHARVHLVAIPEEMVINETLELYQELKKKPTVNLGFLLLNRVLSLKPQPIDEKLYPESAKVLCSLRKRKEEEDLGQRRLKMRGLNLPEIIFFDYMGEIMDSKIIAKMVKIFAKSGD